MPNLGLIRKDILQAIDNHIVPALWRRSVSLGCVIPPLHFSGNIHARLMSRTIPNAEQKSPEFPIQTRWPGVKLHSTFFPYIGFIYEGIADERTLITTAQAKKHDLQSGIYAIRWQAPSVLLFPSGAPHNAGDLEFWEGGDSPPPTRRILWISLGPSVLIHTHQKGSDEVTHVSHSLQISDSSIGELFELFTKKLKFAVPDQQETAQAILLATLLCLRKELETGGAKIANTSRSPVRRGEALVAHENESIVSLEVASFIQMHLHEALTLPEIARQVGLSTVHLNRIFRRDYGTTVMNYVRQQRIAAAKKILTEGSENISEIAVLVGFRRTSAFCDTFRSETGLTPNQYRREKRHSRLIGKSSS